MSLQDELANCLAALEPTVLNIENESSNHGGYFDGKESHFKLSIVSSQFDGLRPVQRHQKVYALVQAQGLLEAKKIHALAIHAFSPAEWQGTRIDSPQCAHFEK